MVGEVWNSVIVGNSARFEAGGARDSQLVNCTVIANSSDSGGGIGGCGAENCIIYFNSAKVDENVKDSSVETSCTYPDPVGSGNITNDPQLASQSRLSSSSPCIGAGYYPSVSGFDIEMQPWSNPPSMGCDEFQGSSNTGALTVAISSTYSNLALEFEIQLTAQIDGALSHSVWDFGDGSPLVSNRPFASHAFETSGVYEVKLTAYNLDFPSGVTETMEVHVVTNSYFVAPGGSHIFPYDTWSKAANDIQSAIDAANIAGAYLLVSNGVYLSGGKAVSGSITNRVAITKPLHVKSVNGPEVTSIVGEGPIGNFAIRCVYVGEHSSLSGFTLTNGHTRSSGDFLVEQSGGGAWCEASGIISNCIIKNCEAEHSGGGVSFGRLDHCILMDNKSGSNGGGAYDATLKFCTMRGNSSLNGGGIRDGVLYNCALIGNSAFHGGGGYYGTFYNCYFTRNSAMDTGGGNGYGTLNNCTLTGNSADSGGGVFSSTLDNCILFFNTSPAGRSNYSASTLRYCCAAPLALGSGNITNAPQLSSAYHLAGSSPCIGEGRSIYAFGQDIDGEAWLSPPSIGCNEFHVGAVTGAVDINIYAETIFAVSGAPIQFAADIYGKVTNTIWDFGDGTILTNQPFVTHSFSADGTYQVTLKTFNQSWPAGIETGVSVEVASYNHYVALGGGHIHPFDTWGKAATNIQAAIDAVVANGASVIVSNGVYNMGVKPYENFSSTRIVIDKPIILRSVNGPNVTIVEGAGPAGPAGVRCVYVGENATISGFTLTNGHTLSAVSVVEQWAGGGAWCEPSAMIEGCVINGNSAGGSGGGVIGGQIISSLIMNNSATFNGGGTVASTVNNSLLLGNSADRDGGGSRYGTLNNCTLVQNTAGDEGGGAHLVTMNNCIVYYNTAPNGANHADSTLMYSCTTPFPGSVGNITNEPQFVDLVTVDFRLLSSSPCIDVGDITALSGFDLLGIPRPLDGDNNGSSIVDMGCYEFVNALSDSDGDSMRDTWELLYGLSPTNAADGASDIDGDGVLARDEHTADLSPLDSNQYFRVNGLQEDGACSVTFSCTNSRNYSLWYVSDLGSDTWVPVPGQTNIPGETDGVMSLVDTNAAAERIYRVDVALP